MPMIDIADLELATPATAPAGSLLIQAAINPRYPAHLMIGGGGPRNALLIAEGRLAFEVVDLSRASGVFLRVAKPRFVVDLASAVSGFDHSPEAGTLFRTPAGLGIVATVDHAECGVLLDGTMVEVDYSQFAGFRHWRIELDGPDDKPYVLFTYRHSGFTENR